MAMMIKNGPGLKGMDRKTTYVWGGCILVFVFVLFALFSVMGGGSDVKPDDFSGMNTKAFDLAQLPFANDAAEQELMDKYTDISGNLPESTLYTPEEKEARQQMDAFAGVPAAPDDEYAAADKNISSSSPASRAYGTPVRAAPTVIGTMTTGTMAGGGGGGSRGTTFNPTNFSGGQRGDNGKIAASKGAADKLAQSATGRSLLGVAGELGGAAKKNAEGANTGLVKAYANSKDTTVMDGDMEKALAGLDASRGGLEAGRGGAGPSVGDVAKAINDAPKTKDPDKKDDKECSGYWDCLWRKGLENLTNGLVDLGVSWAKGKVLGNTDTNSIAGQYQAAAKIKDPVLRERALTKLDKMDVSLGGNKATPESAVNKAAGVTDSK